MPEMTAMRWTEVLLSAAVCAAMLLLGVQLLRGRHQNRIARLHVLSDAAWERIDAPALCRFAGQLLLLIDGLLAVTLVGAIFDWLLVTLICAALTLIASIGGITYMNTHARFRK